MDKVPKRKTVLSVTMTSKEWAAFKRVAREAKKRPGTHAREIILRQMATLVQP